MILSAANFAITLTMANVRLFLQCQHSAIVTVPLEVREIRSSHLAIEP